MLSPAKLVFYGGAAGGGKSDLLLGLAATQHHRSLVLRREAVELQGLFQRISDIGSPKPSGNIFRYNNGTSVTFDGLKEPNKWKKYQGVPFDFYGFDEASYFLKSQVFSIIGWNRTAKKQQRCRVMLAGNPPVTAEGRWIVEAFAPWLDDRYSKPAQPGEIRYFIEHKGKSLEVDSLAPVKIEGIEFFPDSRTFIPARVQDNPYLMETGYLQTLAQLPEPLRSMMMNGDFNAGQEDDDWQVIPTAWIKAAQARFKPEAPGPMDSMGVDVARGGKDQTIIAVRHGNWFNYKAYPGSATPDGPSVAGLVIATLREKAPVHIDAIGVGASVHDFIKDAGVHVVGVIASEASGFMARGGLQGFINRRAELWWKMREALDPALGLNLALPPGGEVLADLAAPRWSLAGAGKIKVELKEDIKKRLGRSPDIGDALCLALLNTPKRVLNGNGWGGSEKSWYPGNE